MEHKVISGESGEIHYWIQGGGDQWVVFTHGATMDHGLFQYQVDTFTQKYTTITWDVPGHGQSRPYEGFTLQKAADELIRILDAEQARTAHLVGQSMGGYICQFAARDNPDRVLSITAVDSSPIQPSYYSALDSWLLAITPSILKLYPYDNLVKTIANQIAVEGPSRAYAFETLQTYSKSEITEIMKAVSRGVKGYGQEADLPVPILILVGESDQSGKVQAYCRQWAERENRPLQIIPDASHNSNMDNPEEFNRILDEFMSRVALVTENELPEDGTE